MKSVNTLSLLSETDVIVKLCCNVLGIMIIEVWSKLCNWYFVMECGIL